MYVSNLYEVLKFWSSEHDPNFSLGMYVSYILESFRTSNSQ